MARLRLLARVLETLRAVGEPPRRAAILTHDEMLLHEAGAPPEMAEGFVNYARALDGVEVGVAALTSSAQRRARQPALQGRRRRRRGRGALRRRRPPRGGRLHRRRGRSTRRARRRCIEALARGAEHERRPRRRQAARAHLVRRGRRGAARARRAARRPHRHARPDGHRRPAGLRRRGDQAGAVPHGGRQGVRGRGCASASPPTRSTPTAQVTAEARRRRRHARRRGARRSPASSARIQQRPPMHSALRVDGQRLYELARAGRRGRARGARGGGPRAASSTRCRARRARALRVRCGKGTYIRSLAADLGERARRGRAPDGAAPDARRAASTLDAGGRRSTTLGAGRPLLGARRGARRPADACASTTACRRATSATES